MFIVSFACTWKIIFVYNHFYMDPCRVHRHFTSLINYFLEFCSDDNFTYITQQRQITIVHQRKLLSDVQLLRRHQPGADTGFRKVGGPGNC